MKTRKIVTLLMACLVAFSGCRKQLPIAEVEDATLPSTHPTAVATTDATNLVPTEELSEEEGIVAITVTEAPGTESTVPTSKQDGGKPSTESTTPKAANPAPTEKGTEPVHSTTTPTAPEPTIPESEPTVPETTEPETKPTVPVTTPTEPKPDEPAGCAHDWTCIHHDELGHWKAGIVCDCGWTVYGDADELVAKWNAHSASYPAEEALFNHGGYGSADKWIVDEPAYDEWVCRHCGESKS